MHKNVHSQKVTTLITVNNDLIHANFSSENRRSFQSCNEIAPSIFKPILYVCMYVLYVYTTVLEIGCIYLHYFCVNIWIMYIFIAIER